MGRVIPLPKGRAQLLAFMGRAPPQLFHFDAAHAWSGAGTDRELSLQAIVGHRRRPALRRTPALWGAGLSRTTHRDSRLWPRMLGDGRRRRVGLRPRSPTTRTAPCLRELDSGSNRDRGSLRAGEAAVVARTNANGPVNRHDRLNPLRAGNPSVGGVSTARRGHQAYAAVTRVGAPPDRGVSRRGGYRRA